MKRSKHSNIDEDIDENGDENGDEDGDEDDEEDPVVSLRALQGHQGSTYLIPFLGGR